MKGWWHGLSAFLNFQTSFNWTKSGPIRSRVKDDRMTGCEVGKKTQGLKGTIGSSSLASGKIS